MRSGRRRPGLAEPHPRQPKPRGVTEMVTAVDDDMWKTDVNATMWQNARYLTWNDKGSGTLKVTSVAGKSSAGGRSEEHTSELQSLMRISYAVFCLKKKKKAKDKTNIQTTTIRY